MSIINKIKLNVSNLDLFYGDNQALKNINMNICIYISTKKKKDKPISMCVWRHTLQYSKNR